MSTINHEMISHGMIDSVMTEALGRFLDLDVACHKLITVNLANIDTPGYRTRDLDFKRELARASWEASAPGLLEAAPAVPIGHEVRGLIERPDGNNVSVERESLLLAESQLRFNLGVQLLKDEFHTISLAINSGGASS
jgi:flagellar basal-body rod protein FlgB